MTKIETKADRKPLNTSLGQLKDTLLVLSGSEDTAAPAIHDSAEANVSEPWRKTFWITDLDVLTAEELEDEDELPVGVDDLSERDDVGVRQLLEDGDLSDGGRGDTLLLALEPDLLEREHFSGLLVYLADSLPLAWYTTP